ncbi:hypothetical protein B0A50_00070 [Salinomyces thailandicus]|uniref:Carboxypeptidase n=1 Tax=Salinomyces thailandicus TaxID=706561 RepID=A0A4U0UEW7_9PEZI|nr:hypothetical protein B0A50_00070 [Salinomyces thailandica]
MFSSRQVFTLPPALAGLLASYIAAASAQYPPLASYQNILTSPLDPNITISYKQPDEGTCTTAFSTQKQYTGYIELPPYTLDPIRQNYSINTFFWFIEARQVPEAAPLTIWLNGGPGSSSMTGMFNEVGPCEVVQTNDGGYGTQARMWGWDRSSNILFIDQPNEVGFSHDVPVNGSYNLVNERIVQPAGQPGVGMPDFLFRNGTFSSTNRSSTANTTDIAAAATWHFLQTWLAAFPQYNPAVRANVTSDLYTTVETGVNLFAESYGGKYGPVFARYFEQQNTLRDNGTLPLNSSLAIRLESVGIINGQIDDAIQTAYYPIFAYNNTYDIMAISQTDELNAIGLFQNGGQCLDHINTCRAAMNATDPEGYGDVAATNDLCEEALFWCQNVTASYYARGFNPYDIRQLLPSPDPPAAYQEYLNNASVLASIGAKINYTESSAFVQRAFISTGDTIRGGQIEDLAYLLDQGIRVALIYGDADYICNWYGGQAISLAIASRDTNCTVPTTVTDAIAAMASTTPLAPACYSTAFPAAGYAEIVVNNSYVGGSVRQFGNLSFSRIYDAGHFVPYFQPETAFTVFTRIIQGNDISTGDGIDLSVFGTTGPVNATHTNSAPSDTPTPTCWLRSLRGTCSQDDLQAMIDGEGVVANGIFYQDKKSVNLPSSSVAVGMPGSPMSSVPSISGSSSGGSSGSDDDSGSASGSAMSDSVTKLTGVYTATGTPSPSSGAAVPVRLSWSMYWGSAVVWGTCFAVGVVLLV